MNTPNELRRVKVELVINVTPRQTAAELTDWINRFFTFYHPNLEARVTALDKSQLAVDEPQIDGAELLGGVEEIDGAALLGGEPDGMDLLS